MLTETEKCWLQIFRSKNVGPVTFNELFKKYNPEQAMNFLKAKNISIASRNSVDAEITKTKEFGARIIFLKHAEYPKTLLNYRDSPPFLIVKGRIDLLNTRCISIIGSRSSSLHGNKITRDLAAFLCEKGYTVVSGMAKGIDANAHTGTLQVNNSLKTDNIKRNCLNIDKNKQAFSTNQSKKSAGTIAFLAGGIDNIYPTENAQLYSKIASEGLLVSENPIGTIPAAMYFHSRNRIVAAISEVVVVVEATKNSGSLITAQYALDYGKEICCVPGCPLDPRSYGPNRLIKNGASLIQTPSDVLEILEERKKVAEIDDVDVLAMDFEEGKVEKVKKADFKSLKDKLLSCISHIPVQIEQLVDELDYPTNIIRQNLMELEIEGFVKHAPGDLILLANDK